MFSAVRSKLTYAHVVATLALFVALGGSSYAAISLSKNSVKSRHIAKGQVKRSDLGKNAVTSPKVRDFSLLASDFARGQIPSGAKGEQGEQGLQGLQGLQGEPGADGAPGTARAFGRVGILCGGSPAFCPITRNKGIAYAVRVGTGTYCVGVNGITPADSVAIVSVAEDQFGEAAVEWRQTNSACVSSEFEIETYLHGQTSVRNASNSGTVVVATPAAKDSAVNFAIAIP